MNEPSSSAYYAMLGVIKHFESTLSAMKKLITGPDKWHDIHLVHPCDIDELIHQFEATYKTLQQIRRDDSK